LHLIIDLTKITAVVREHLKKGEHFQRIKGRIPELEMCAATLNKKLKKAINKILREFVNQIDKEKIAENP